MTEQTAMTGQSTTASAAHDDYRKIIHDCERTGQSVELLAPGGSPEGIRRCVLAGADAVYAGGAMFGARAFADNPDTETLEELIDFCHLHGAKLYLTVNTLLREEELEKQLYRYIEPFYLRGVDAVLVQDLGVLSFLKTEFPGLPLHASTQMSVSSIAGAAMLHDLGCSRIVPARELSLKEIDAIHRAVPVEIETFIHGALCYSYSGQCLMSSMIGGRSGNRGRCAQPCRQPYRPDGAGKEAYLLSLKDICTLDLLPDLLRAGVCSLKIEGRMKRPEYAAGVTAVYRRHLDCVLRGEAPVSAAEVRDLMDLYNRGGFSGGFYDGNKGPYMMAMDRPNHAGTQAALVEGYDGKRKELVLKALEDLSADDVLEAVDEGGAGSLSFLPGKAVRRGQTFRVPAAGKGIRPERGTAVPKNDGKSAVAGKGIRPERGTAALRSDGKPAVSGKGGLPERGAASGKGSIPGKGTVLPRIRNEELLRRIRAASDPETHRLETEGFFQIAPDRPMELELTLPGRASVRVTGATAQWARTAEVTEETLRRQLTRTGDSPFVMRTLKIDAEHGAFCPVGELNALRREALRQLEEALLAPYRRTIDAMIPAAAERAASVNETKPAAADASDRILSSGTPAENETEPTAEAYGRKEWPETPAENEPEPATDAPAERLPNTKADEPAAHPFLTASAETTDQIRALLSVPEIRRIYVDCMIFLPPHPARMAYKASRPEGLNAKASSPDANHSKESRAAGSPDANRGEENRATGTPDVDSFAYWAEKIHSSGKECFLMLPPVWREDIREDFFACFPASRPEGAAEEQLPADAAAELIPAPRPAGAAEEQLPAEAAENSLPDGYLVRNMQELYEPAFRESGKVLVTDESVYTWNRRSREVLASLGVTEDTVPSELNSRELGDRGCRGSEVPVYGREVLMTTASCLQKNTRGCLVAGVSDHVRRQETRQETQQETRQETQQETQQKTQQETQQKTQQETRQGIKFIEDRKHADFPVRMLCGICTNRIYNSVPLDLSRELGEIGRLAPASLRLRFTFESAEETAAAAARFAAEMERLIWDRSAASSDTHASAGQGAQAEQRKISAPGSTPKGKTQSAPGSTLKGKTQSASGSTPNGKAPSAPAATSKGKTPSAPGTTRGHFRRGVE